MFIVLHINSSRALADSHLAVFTVAGKTVQKHHCIALVAFSPSQLRRGRRWYTSAQDSRFASNLLMNAYTVFETGANVPY